MFSGRPRFPRGEVTGGSSGCRGASASSVANGGPCSPVELLRGLRLDGDDRPDAPDDEQRLAGPHVPHTGTDRRALVELDPSARGGRPPIRVGAAGSPRGRRPSGDSDGAL